MTVADIDCVETIFGPSLITLKGKKICQDPEPVIFDYVALPHKILQANKDVTLFGIILFVNQIPFFNGIWSP